MKDICDHVYKKYNIMRIRQKISYTSLQRSMIVKELLLFTIIRSYLIQKKEGDFAEDKVKRTNDKFFDDIVDNDMN
jgi:hypothetical protein